MTTNIYTDDFIEKELHRIWTRRNSLHWKDAAEIAKLVRDDTAAAKDAEIARLTVLYQDATARLLNPPADDDEAVQVEIAAKDAQIATLEQLCETQSDNLQRYAGSESKHNHRYSALLTEYCALWDATIAFATAPEDNDKDQYATLIKSRFWSEVADAN